MGLDMDRLEQRLREHAETVQKGMKIKPVDFHECGGLIGKDSRSDNADISASPRPRQGFHRRLRVIIAVALIVLAVVVGTFSVSALFGSDFLNKVLNSKDMKSEAETGEWFYHKGDTIVIVVPESPVEVFISKDGGETWDVSRVGGTDCGYHFGELKKGFEYANSYVGLNEDGSGYLVLTTGLALGSQEARIFLTQDEGKTWGEIKNLDGIRMFMVTGAGYSPEEIVFMSFRYYLDWGPDIWYTEDRGENWQRMPVEIPEKYAEYRFDAQSPSFDGLKGIYPLKFWHEADGKEERGVINLVSDDGGRTWAFEEKNDIN